MSLRPKLDGFFFSFTTGSRQVSSDPTRGGREKRLNNKYICFDVVLIIAITEAKKKKKKERRGKKKFTRSHREKEKHTQWNCRLLSDIRFV